MGTNGACSPTALVIAGRIRAFRACRPVIDDARSVGTRRVHRLGIAEYAETELVRTAIVVTSARARAFLTRAFLLAALFAATRENAASSLNADRFATTVLLENAALVARLHWGLTIRRTSLHFREVFTQAVAAASLIHAKLSARDNVSFTGTDLADLVACVLGADIGTPRNHGRGRARRGEQSRILAFNQ
jgi:hypothetical protein